MDEDNSEAIQKNDDVYGLREMVYVDSSNTRMRYQN